MNDMMHYGASDMLWREWFNLELTFINLSIRSLVRRAVDLAAIFRCHE